jgi:hypothetical protein
MDLCCHESYLRNGAYSGRASQLRASQILR